MPDPIGGRRRDDPSDASSAVPVMSPWDLVFERLDRLERTQSDVARMELQIPGALPAVTGFAVGQGLALGSPIDSRNTLSPPPPPPLIGIPPPQRIEPVTPAHAAFAELQIPGMVMPDAAPALGAIPEPPPYMPPPPPMGTPLSDITGFDLTMPEPKAGKLFGRRKAKRAAADRTAIASLLSTPPPPPLGFMGSADAGAGAPPPPPPPGGFSLDALPPPPPLGFMGSADAGAGAPPPPPPPPPGGFSLDAPPP